MWHLAKYNIPLYLRDKRSGKLARRLHRKERAVIRAQKERIQIDRQFGDHSKILDLLAKGQAGPTLEEMRKGRVKFVAPSIFSMMDNWTETLSCLSSLAAYLSMPRVRLVEIDMHQVSTYDLGANGLLDTIVEEGSVRSRRTGRRVRWKGSYPSNDQQRRLVRSLGVIKFLEVKHEYNPTSEASRLESFHDRCKHYVRAVRANETDRKSRTTQKFADHINKCLRRAKLVLKPEARKKLCDYVSEILDNAEEHAGMYDWTIQGYLDSHSKDLVCEIVIFNFGKTIAEKMADPGPYTAAMIKPYLDAHASKGFFSTKWRREDLLTLIALQGSVSSKNRSTQDTRGNGTVDLISFFQKMSKECRDRDKGTTAARMTLISGSTRILFDGTYEMQRNKDGIGIIAFNGTNDLGQPPDSNFVTHFDGQAFPGTMLSIKFPLSAEASTSAVSGGTT